jgi:hypothetical protein
MLGDTLGCASTGAPRPAATMRAAVFCRKVPTMITRQRRVCGCGQPPRTLRGLSLAVPSNVLDVKSTPYLGSVVWGFRGFVRLALRADFFLKLFLQRLHDI